MRTAAALLALLIACGDNGGPTTAAEKPAVPQANDPAFELKKVHSWYLLPDGNLAGDQTMKIEVTAPAGSDFVDAWVGPLDPVRLEANGDGTFSGEVSIESVPSGTYTLVFAADGASDAFGAAEFHRSAAYYVLLSTDWDFSDPGAFSLMTFDLIHAYHPAVKMTDFVGPYTYTDPAVTDERRGQISSFLQKMRDTHGDELGVHIHPYCNFVAHAGVTCVTDRSTVNADNIDTSGYTIELDSYSRADMDKMLDDAASLFQANGLGTPKTFRAGGWTASLDTLNALADKGYVADSSALNWARIEEWEGQGNGVLYTWNMEHWGPIDDTSQPYHVSEADILSSAPPTLPILEVPDNGVMIDYVSLDEMTGIFDANWDGDPLATPITLMMGFHPASGFTQGEQDRVLGFLTYADGHLASEDLGPVVYATLSQVTTAFSSQ
jgi:hypothetical protein